MQIGAVAKRLGVTPDAIRFYERNALLPPPSRTAGGFRQYRESDVETLQFIRRVQELGFTLKEFSELLALRHTRLQPCAPVRCQLERKLFHVRQKVADLQELEHQLRMALRRCSNEMRKRPAHCPLLRETNQRKPGAAK